ncbi:hypothetical protein HJA85_25155 [Rhizobium bangladeshense]|uniref:hypothetical protein n=1 Tax=Rhizobium bangladeshense TaxID=1138189 RepID=UPI001C83E671|nr:hypothetical protein [Rhizobium bangladeshense]MBX4870229.1 hypothetical protein [Rhizobium bangladeshense]
MKKILAALISLLPLLNGCGTYVPSIREWPKNDTLNESDMIAAIIRSVSCELSYTVTQVIENDKREALDRSSKKTYSDFLREWGVEVAVNLTVVERTSVNPSVLFTPPITPTTTFTLSGGFTASAEATRLQKTNVFFTIDELYHPAFFNVDKPERRCRDPRGNKEGSLLVDSDLKLSSLLEGRIGASILGFADTPSSPALLVGQKNVLSQSVSFKIVTAGGLTPTWKLVRATYNPTGILLSTGRDRTHELVFTFGPLDKSVKGRPWRLTPLAEQTHLNTQLQTGLRGFGGPFQ